MTDQVPGTRACPTDGAMMEQRRRWVWRCPECHGLFLEGEAMRRRDRRMTVLLPFALSLGLSIGLTLLIRRLQRRPAMVRPATADAA